MNNKNNLIFFTMNKFVYLANKNMMIFQLYSTIHNSLDKSNISVFLARCEHTSAN